MKTLPGISFQELADQFGTPLYVYSNAILSNSCQQWKQAAQAAGCKIHYAVKANSNHSLLKKIFQFGFGADVVSQGEIERCLHAGLAPHQIVFSGVGKTNAELEYALTTGIGTLHVESKGE